MRTKTKSTERDKYTLMEKKITFVPSLSLRKECQVSTHALTSPFYHLPLHCSNRVVRLEIDEIIAFCIFKFGD